MQWYHCLLFQVCQLLKRVYIFCDYDVIIDDKTTPDFTLNVGCADPKYLRSFSNISTPNPSKVDAILKVGPIVDSSTKKKDFTRSLNDVYSKMFKCYYDISTERQEENVSKNSILQVNSMKMIQPMEEWLGDVWSSELSTGGGDGPRNPHISAITQKINFTHFESRTGKLHCPLWNRPNRIVSLFS